MALKHDPILGTEREIGIIPQLDADPANPKKERAWVLKTTTGGAGGGVLQFLYGAHPITSNGAISTSYQFSYRTKEGTTKRVTIS